MYNGKEHPISVQARNIEDHAAEKLKEVENDI